MLENADLANDLYWACYALGFITIFIFNTLYAKKYKLSASKGLLFTLSSYALIYLWAYVLAWAINGFEWGHHNAIRVYIWFPLVLFLLGKLFHVRFRAACDYMAPSTCIVYGIARFGCVFPGCCYGVPAEWGLYSAAAGHNCFPVQFLEAVTSLAIGFIVLYLAFRKQYAADGKLYPTMLVMYGVNRFVWELFSASPRVFLGITELGIWAFGTAAMGTAWLILRAKKKTA